MNLQQHLRSYSFKEWYNPMLEEDLLDSDCDYNFCYIDTDNFVSTLGSFEAYYVEKYNLIIFISSSGIQKIFRDFSDFYTFLKNNNVVN